MVVGCQQERWFAWTSMKTLAELARKPSVLREVTCIVLSSTSSGLS